MRVPLRVRVELLLARDGTLDFLRRNYPLFDKAVRDYCRDCPMEEIQDSVMHSLEAYTEFVNAVAQEIGFGPPQFVAQFPQSLQSEIAFILCLRRQLAEPVQKRARTVVLTVEHDSRSWH